MQTMESRRFSGLLLKMLSCYLVSVSDEVMMVAKQDFPSDKNVHLWNSHRTVLDGIERRLLKQERPAEWKPGRPLSGKASSLEPELSAKFRGERMRNSDAARGDIALRLAEAR